MKDKFKTEIKEWMKNVLSPYCLKECKNSCCDCTKEGGIPIDFGHEHLFKTFKIGGKKVHFSNDGKNGPHLYKDKHGRQHFTGGLCPNYDLKNKKCLIYNQHPMCALFPLGKTEEGYQLISACELNKMNPEKEPLKSLLAIFKKHGIILIL